jgi:hypothetical protein
MPTTPSPFGLPIDLGIGLDWLTFVWALTALVMLGGLVFLLWAIGLRYRAQYRVECPTHGTEALIRVRLPRGRRSADVEACSLMSPSEHVTCAKQCLHLVA